MSRYLWKCVCLQKALPRFLCGQQWSIELESRSFGFNFDPSSFLNMRGKASVIVLLIGWHFIILFLRSSLVFISGKCITFQTLACLMIQKVLAFWNAPVLWNDLLPSPNALTFLSCHLNLARKLRRRWYLRQLNLVKSGSEFLPWSYGWSILHNWQKHTCADVGLECVQWCKC